MQEINFTWQTGLEALAYVPQYLLYKQMSGGARKKRENENN